MLLNGLCWYSLLHWTRNHSPDWAVLWSQTQTLPLAQIRSSAPSQPQVRSPGTRGSKMLTLGKNSTHQAEIVLLYLNEHVPVCVTDTLPRQKWLWSKDRDEAFPALIGIWWIAVSAGSLATLRNKNQPQTHSLSRVNKHKAGIEITLTAFLLHCLQFPSGTPVCGILNFFPAPHFSAREWKLVSCLSKALRFPRVRTLRSMEQQRQEMHRTVFSHFLATSTKHPLCDHAVHSEDTKGEF